MEETIGGVTIVQGELLQLNSHPAALLQAAVD
jgi:hypothetical protein